MKIIVNRVPRIVLLFIIVLLAAFATLQSISLERALKEIAQTNADSCNAINDCQEQLNACKDACGLND
jgi:hypothetical protein